MEGIILITKKELKELILECLSIQKPVETKSIKYYTRQETAARLNVTLPTLNKYVNDGKIKCHRIGRRVLFTEDGIINSLKERKKNIK